jgi:hypothetical protein
MKGHPEEIMKMIAGKEQLQGIHFILTISIACAPATGYSQSPQIRVFFLSLLL